jgi:uncharacterized protein
MINKSETRRKLLTTGKWLLWIILFQFLLVNVSGMLYAYRLTHFFEPAGQPKQPPPTNLVLKTWTIFNGPRLEKMTAEPVPRVPFTTVRLAAGNDVTLDAWNIPLDSARGTVILFHGLGLNKSSLLDEAYEFRDLGFRVVLVDMRAHGLSTGHTSTLGVRESADVRATFDYVQAAGEKNIVLYGFSLGAVAVAKAVGDYDLKPRAVILDLPVESLRKLIAVRGRLLGFSEEPFGAFVSFWISVERGFNAFRQHTSSYVRKLNCPVLMQSGGWDLFTSPAEARKIFGQVASTQKKLVFYENAGHEPLLQADIFKWRKEVSGLLAQ